MIRLKEKCFQITLNYNNYMKGNCLKIKPRMECSAAHLFLKDPQSDFFVVMGEKILPLHKRYVSSCAYFADLMLRDKKIHFISKKFKSQYFEKVLGYFYGLQIEINRQLEIEPILQIITFLGAAILKEQIQRDFYMNFNDYGIFQILKISVEKGYEKLRRKCMKMLLLQNYEQMNYNKYDFFQCSPQTFMQVIKQCNKNGNKKSMPQKMLLKIIDEYCDANQVSIDSSSLISSVETCNTNEPKVEHQLQYQQSMSYKNKAQFLKINNDNLLSLRSNSSIDQSIVDLSFEEKKLSLLTMKKINSQLHIRGSQMLNELNNLKEQINERDQKIQNSNEDNIDNQLKSFSVSFREHDEKMSILQIKINKVFDSGVNGKKRVVSQEQRKYPFEAIMESNKNVKNQMKLLRKKSLKKSNPLNCEKKIKKTGNQAYKMFIPILHHDDYTSF